MAAGFENNDMSTLLIAVFVCNMPEIKAELHFWRL